MTKQDVDNINTERMNSYREGQVIDMQGSKYKFDGNAIAQSIASGNDTGSLQTVADLHHDMNAWKTHAEKIARYGDRQGEHKEEYERANAEYEKYKADYNQALTAYSSAAADGLSSFITINKTSSEEANHTNTKLDSLTENVSINGGTSINFKLGNFGVSFLKQAQSSESEQFSSGNKTGLIANRNELERQIRDTIHNGLNEDMDEKEIISKIRSSY